MAEKVIIMTEAERKAAAKKSADEHVARHNAGNRELFEKAGEAANPLEASERRKLAYLETQFAELGNAMPATSRLSLHNLRTVYGTPVEPEPQVSPSVAAIKEVAELEEVIGTLREGSAAWAHAASLLAKARGSSTVSRTGVPMPDDALSSLGSPVPTRSSEFPERSPRYRGSATLSARPMSGSWRMPRVCCPLRGPQTPRRLPDGSSRHVCPSRQSG